MRASFHCLASILSDTSPEDNTADHPTLNDRGVEICVVARR